MNKKSNWTGGGTPPPVSKLISTHTTGTYNTGVANDVGDAAATEDGTFGVLNKAIVGENAHLHFLDQLTAEHDAARGVIAHALRGALLVIVATLSHLLPKLKINRENAFSAIDAHKSALKQQLVLVTEFVTAGVPLPSKRKRWFVALKLVGLFAGDWALIAVGFQLFGLSDHPWIPGVGFTDDLHLAAVSSVAALIFLGDRAGIHLGRIEHALEQRRYAQKEDRAGLPHPAPLDGGLLLLWLVAAVMALLALANIRTEYLAQNGIDANATAFVLLQLGIFTAALAIGYAAAPHPEAEQWRSRLVAATTEVQAAATVQKQALKDYMETVGQYNAGVRHLDSEVAQAGHHVLADAGSVASQQHAYPRRYLLSQQGDQIATESILADGYDDLPEYSGQDLLEALTGAKPLPTFRLLTTDSVEQALANARAEVSRLRSRIDQKAINQLNLPDFETSDDEQITSDELPDALPEVNDNNTENQLHLLSVHKDSTDEDAVDAEIVGDEESA